VASPVLSRGEGSPPLTCCSYYWSHKGRELSSQLAPSIYWCLSMSPARRVQVSAPPFVELHDVPVSPFLQPVQVSLDSSTTLWRISHSSHFCINRKLAEVALCPIM